MVYSTRSAADLMEVGADKKRWTTWTEYSVAKLTLRTKDMLEKAVRFTFNNILRPMTGTKHMTMVNAIRRPPQRLATALSFDPKSALAGLSSKKRKTVATTNPTATATPLNKARFLLTVRYCSQKSKGIPLIKQWISSLLSQIALVILIISTVSSCVKSSFTYKVGEEEMGIGDCTSSSGMNSPGQVSPSSFSKGVAVPSLTRSPPLPPVNSRHL
mmetsp:Transcript_22502/g.33339  ORF Transcript_22502/g.33339 Transcript_22502/m.33339 type:complete len:215 (-) Transcript_22502:3458-4102(-)